VSRRVWLCIPAVALCVLDHAATIWGQPSYYWSDGYRYALEGCPHGRWLLQQHPLAFAGLGLVSIGLYCAAILGLPRRPALVVTLTVVMGHGWGTSTWILQWVPYGYWLCLLLCLASSVLVLIALEKNPRPVEPVESLNRILEEPSP
jgi:hypothetical protein